MTLTYKRFAFLMLFLLAQFVSGQQTAFGDYQFTDASLSRERVEYEASRIVADVDSVKALYELEMGVNYHIGLYCEQPADSVGKWAEFQQLFYQALVAQVGREYVTVNPPGEVPPGLENRSTFLSVGPLFTSAKTSQERSSEPIQLEPPKVIVEDPLVDTTGFRIYVEESTLNARLGTAAPETMDLETLDRFMQDHATEIAAVRTYLVVGEDVPYDRIRPVIDVLRAREIFKFTMITPLE